MQRQASLLLGQVQYDRTLPAVNDSERQVDPTRGIPSDSLTHKTAIGVPRRWLDTDHVCAPVGQERPRRRSEDPLCQLDDPNAPEGLLSRSVLQPYPLLVALVLDMGVDSRSSAWIGSSGPHLSRRRRPFPTRTGWAGA
jgi:hypothetical protein